MVATVDIEHLAGNEPGSIVCEEGRGDAHIVDVDQFARRRFDLRLFQKRIELGNA